MARKTVVAAAMMAGVVGLASSASADVFTKAGVSGGGWNAAITDFYKLPTEDGTAEDSIGFGANGTIAYANQFTIAAGGTTITDINIVFGANSAANVPHTFAIWTTPGPLTNMTLVTSSAAIAGGAPGSSISVDIPDASFNVGDVVYVGFLAEGGPTSFFGAWDNQAPHSGASYIWGTPALGAFTAANIGAAAAIGEIGGFGLAGDWLIRANAVPAPSALGLLGLGALVGLRRRR